MSSKQAFGGFPKDALRFFKNLQNNNEREWFQDHKAEYEEHVLGPALDFVEVAGAELKKLSRGIQADPRRNGSGSIMRLHRDVRFSKDKSPYKAWLGINFWEGKGKKTECPGFYFHMDGKGAFVCGGIHGFPKPMLSEYRKAVVDPRRGRKLTEAIAELPKGCSLEGVQYKRVPRGVDPDHERADLLLHGGLYAMSATIPAATVTSGKLLSECLKQWKKMMALERWLVTLQKRI